VYLPNDITQNIYNSVGAQYDSQQRTAFVDCSLANSDATLDFTFSSPTIRVSMNELVIVAGYDRGQPVCIFGISPAEGNTPVLGDTFLRSAYVVYDMSANTISLAQTAFNVTTSNILEINNSTSGGGDPVPSATRVADAVTSVAVESGGARIEDYTTGISSALAVPTASHMAYSAALVGAVGAAVFAL
jgi:hypothetical protein